MTIILVIMPQSKAFRNRLSSASRFLQRSTNRKDDTNQNPSQKSKLNNLKVTETDSGFQYELKIPGYIKEDFNFYVNNNDLVVTTGRSNLNSAKKEDNIKNNKHSYCYPSALFKLRIPLPNKLIKKEIFVDYKNEVLNFQLLKLQ